MMKSFKPFLISLFVISFIPLLASADERDSLFCHTQSSLKPTMISLDELNKLTVSDDGIRKWQKQNEMQELPISVILGDVNKDNDMDISDVVTLVNYILSGESATGTIDMWNADINKDACIDISDVVGLVNMILEGIRICLICPDDHHPHLIDLGLPSGTLWSCCNVGANAPEDSGGYYAWGETEEKSVYYWDTYIHCNGSYDTCHNLGNDIAGTEYDVAHVQWGGSWKMPSYEQFSELIEYCTSEWTEVEDIHGRKFTGSNGGSIFIPAVGYRWRSGFIDVGSYGYCWSSTPYPSYSFYAYGLYFSSGGSSALDYRYYGRNVRPVYRR